MKIAKRVQGLAVSRSILAAGPVVANLMSRLLDVAALTVDLFFGLLLGS